MFIAIECGRRKSSRQKRTLSTVCLPFYKPTLRGGDLCSSAIHLGVGHAGRARTLLFGDLNKPPRFSDINKPPSSQTKGLEVKTR